jgi:hypothetical protein
MTVTAPSTVPARRARTSARPETATVQIPGAAVSVTACVPVAGRNQSAPACPVLLVELFVTVQFVKLMIEAKPAKDSDRITGA